MKQKNCLVKISTMKTKSNFEELPLGGSSFVLDHDTKYKAVIFDLDGTLVNTGPLITESFRHTITHVFHEDGDLWNSGF